ncbi:Brp/Blh family beta-carotene 15,15'-monooxygenase/lycopene cyclase-like protein [Pedobacter sp. UYEF25]
METSELDKPTLKFDFLFIGLGAANCLLILRLNDHNLLKGKTIAIIEPDTKSTNDRTFCFWATEDELAKLNLANLISYSWNCIEINGITKQRIDPLHYFHIKGIDLYNETKKQLGFNEVKFFRSFLIEKPILKSTYHEVKLDNETIYAQSVFDSRPPFFLKPTKIQSHLYQSFYGWKIKTVNQIFDTSTMVMMDFNIPQSNFTQFIYILPFTGNTALIELTRFGGEKLLKEDAHLILADYVKKLGVPFEVLDFEQGVIPMSSAKLVSEDFGNTWINMGVRSGVLKCSTGYAFHSMAEDASALADAIKKKQLPSRKSRKQRFALYDLLLLNILNERPQYGKLIFETLFKKIPVPSVLSFLREKTSIVEEISIFSKLPIGIFILTALKYFLHQINSLPVLAFPFILTIFTIVLSHYNLAYISWGILAVGFLSIGLSHGALDYLTESSIVNKKQLLYFVISYLFKSILLAIVWLFLPDVALIIFIGYSAWHFGQADFKEWTLKQGLPTFLWGLVLLMTLFFFHFKELNLILTQIPNLSLPTFLQKIPQSDVKLIQIAVVTGGLLLAMLKKSSYIIYTLTYILLCSFLPLLAAFGIYFIGQHSIHGWRHLSKGLNETSFKLWVKSLPFSAGGALIILYFIFFSGPNYVGMFFIILSCLSIPHVFSMHRFYLKFNHRKHVKISSDKANGLIS